MKANKDLHSFGQSIRAREFCGDDFYLFTGHLDPAYFCELVDRWLEGKEKI